MSISITDRDKVLNSDLRKLCTRRLLFALSRFDSSIVKITLVVSDENGPRGGVDKSCRVSVSLRQAKSVVITDKDSEVMRCISRVADRAGRAVARAVERKQEFDRSRIEFIEPLLIDEIE